MGIKATPPYVNIFMDENEETVREVFIWAILFWKRFINDIFVIFLVTTNQLQPLQDFMNHLHSTIKLTFQHSTQQISFLDMKIQIGADRKVSTRLYRKTTDSRHLYTFTPTTNSSAKKTSFFHKLSETTSSLQMITYYKKNSIPSQYLSLPENTR